MTSATRLVCEYDGTRFAGWARQPGLRTVQGELETALATLLRRPVDLTVAGRTDRGVHAWGQVASYPGEPPDLGGVNALTPPDLAILEAAPAHAGFDARRDALSRTYCYRILNRRQPSAFEVGRAWHVPYGIDRDALRKCAALLRGTHDFTAFTPTETDHVRFERHVLAADWRVGSAERRAPGGGAARARDRAAEAGGGAAEEGGGDLLEFWITADAFMRHMNRVLVGTMLEVAQGRRELDDVAKLLEGAPRERAGVTAPPHGLYFARVAYARDAAG